jgi:L-lactate dehydrogenase complex protein LldE
MIIRHYPALFADDPNWRARAEALADKTHELMAFLVRIRGMTSVSARYDGRIAYHDSCSGLRELGISAEPRQLLASVAGASLVPLADADVCCGFGGTFAVKYDEISDRIVTEKAQSAEASGADTLCAGDLGCLLNIAGKLSRKGSSIRVRHVAEILAGIADTPAIGEARASVADARAKPNEP